MRVPAFVGPTYQSASVMAAQQDTINLYVEQIEDRSGPEQAVYYPTPGLELLDAAQTGPGRAHFSESGREWAVIGADFGEISSAGAFSSKGSVAVDEFPATISSNGDGGGELFVTSGTNGYIYDLDADTLTQVTALDGQASMGAFLNGYFIALDRASSTFFLSDLLDGTTWDPTQFAQRSTAPDSWQSLFVADKYLWLPGEKTTDVWFDAGSFPFPFEPHPSGLLKVGIAAPFSLADVEGGLMWLGQSEKGRGMVIRTQGFAPGRVSTHPIQAAVQDLVHLDDAIGDSYEDQGHTFYLLSVPAASITYAWDAVTGLWAKRGTWIKEERQFVAWRPRFHTFAYGQHRWLDSENGNIYRSDVNLFYDVDGRNIRRVRRAPAIDYELERVYHSSFELNMQTGVGTHATTSQVIPADLFAGAADRFYYEFEGSGNDQFGNADLSAINSPTFAPGRHNLGTQLTRITDTSDSPYWEASGVSFSADDADMIIACKVRLDSLTEETALFSLIETEGGTGIGLTVDTNGAITLSGLGDNVVTSNAALLPDGEIHCVSARCVLDATSGYLVTIDVDGSVVLEDGVGGETNFDPDGRTMRWGRHGSASYDGLLDQCVLLADKAWDDDDAASYCAQVDLSTDPMVMLRWSQDGGHTWSSEHWRSAGKVGEYKTRVRWRRLGQARRRVYEIAVSDPVPWQFIDAYLETSQPPRRLPRARQDSWDS